MLTLYEKIAFIVIVLVSAYLTWNSFSQMVRIINKGQGKLHFDNLLQRIFKAIKIVLLQNTVLKDRLILSIIHTFVAWAFILYFLVNVGDVLYG